MTHDQIPQPDVIEPDSEEARRAVWERWRRARRKWYPDEVVVAGDLDPDEWEDTLTTPVGL